MEKFLLSGSVGGDRMTIHIFENGIYIDIDITDEGDVRLRNLSLYPSTPSQDKDRYKKYRLVEIHESGMNQNDHHGSKHTGSCPGYLLIYKEHHDYRNEYGRKLEIVQSYNGLVVISHLQFYDGISVVRSWTEMRNESDNTHSIEYVSSFALTGLPPWWAAERWRVVLFISPTTHGMAKHNGSHILCMTWDMILSMSFL